MSFNFFLTFPKRNYNIITSHQYRRRRRSIGLSFFDVEEKLQETCKEE